MSGREPQHLADPDDWFADPDRSAPLSWNGTTAVEALAIRSEESGAADAWLDDEPTAARLEGPIAGFTVKLGTLLAVAAIVVVLIVLAGLAIAGVFSASGKHPATNPTTAPTLTTTQTPSTTTPAARPAHRVPPTPATTLKPGDQGVQVKLLQRALAQLGYPTGATDGIYGRSTQAALRRFQEASALAADGVLGPKTLQGLKQALQING